MTTLNLLHHSLTVKDKQRHEFGELHGSSLGLVISDIAAQYQHPCVVITPDNLTANRLEYEIKFYSDKRQAIFTFPDWETLPFDNFSPHQDIISQRLRTLWQLPQTKQAIIIVPISTLMQRICPCDFIDSHTLILKQGDKLDLEHTRQRLTQNGYHAVTQVMEHGEFAIRGSIFDLFPSGSETPIRIDLFDDEIDSIRLFDPETQKSTSKVTSIELLPAREFPLTDEAITFFRQSWRNQFPGNPAKMSIYQDVSDGLCPPGIEYYLPLFFPQLASLFDYLPTQSLYCCVADINQAAEKFWHEVKHRHQQRAYDIENPILKPEQIYLSAGQVLQQLKQLTQIRLQQQKITKSGDNRYNFATTAAPELLIEQKATDPFTRLNNFVADSNSRILFCAESAGRREVLLELLKNNQIHPVIYENWQQFFHDDKTVGIVIAPLDEGLSLTEPKITVIAEPQLFGQHVMQRRRRKQTPQDHDAIIKNLTELTLNAPVVHIEHGVGYYKGLEVIKLGDIETEFLTLEYAENNKLYVPVSSLHLISRYTGADSDHVSAHRLGTENWQKAKRKAAEKVRDVAAELLEIYAKREARKGHQFSVEEQQYQIFVNQFQFEPTPDQEKAINCTIEDMRSEKSMDRLVCGDVGFGKTEVAMRAAFMAVQSGMQVALLVPTTLLAQQHYQNFCDRFADWPIQVEVLSRFKNKEQQQTVIEKTKLGKVDILIGTHKIIQPDIKFKSLGLLIIDEEHRFGVRQKETFKAMRSEVDILTLTATPIPRTLNMAMSGVRDLSIIATPPAKRLSIKTFVRQYNKGVIKEAVLRELMRGGQVFFLHNKVEDIERTAQELTELIPEARISVAHGQMRERELEQVMSDFYHRRFNVLVCTTIIETGIDIPTANTIIINRADKFGLAQLHQLRGRVGRSHHQAYAYLMTPPKKAMTKDAIKRLDAIASLEDLGVGFTLATHDLEIRGAGEILGDEQSGHIQAVGFTLYMEMLDRAVNALKAGKMPELENDLYYGPEIDIKISALIPDEYIGDIHMRLMLYKRISNACDENALRELQVEMIDRFGLLPQQVKNLFAVTELKFTAQKLGIRKIDANAKMGKIEFEDKPNVDPMTILNLIQTRSQRFKLDGPNKLKFELRHPQPEHRIDEVSQVLSLLA